MLQIKKLKWVLLIVLFFVSMGFSQDDFFGDEDEDVQVEVVCIPENLAVSYDSLAGTVVDALELKMLYGYGSEHFKNKNYGEAIPYLWKVFLNNSPSSNRAVGKIAESYFKQNKIDSTLIACYKGLEKFPDQQKLHYYAGFLQKELGKATCALPHYEALVAKNPKNKAYLSELAFLYYKTGNFENAIKTQTKIIELYPDDSKAQDMLPKYIEASGESPLIAYEKAWNQDNTNFDAGRSLARCAIEEGEYQKVLNPLNIIIAKEPKAADYKLRASAYENLSQFTKAIKDLNSWLSLDPDNVDILLNIAINYSSLNKFSTANSWITKAIHKKPGYGKPYIVRGELYEAMVGYCQGNRNNGKVEIEDKIVYEKAQKVYAQAQKDLSFKSKSKIKISNLKPFIRTAEDKFMAPNAKIKSSCYSFLVQK
jgi:tetratricopeptide (TPR) repeat protein